MSKRFFCQAMCLLMAAVLTLPLLAPAVLAAQSDDTVTIRTVSDLLELAKNCTLDTWSQGKTVRLEADLDLSGSGFSAIPTFGGTFMGNGHTISGLSLTADGAAELADALRGVSGALQELDDAAAGSADLKTLGKAIRDMVESMKETRTAVEKICVAVSDLIGFVQFGDLSTAMDDLADAIDRLSSAADSLRTALEQLRQSANDGASMGIDLQDAFRQLGDLSDDAGETAKLPSASVDKIRVAVDYLRQTGPITLIPADDAYRAAGDRLFDDLTGVSAAMNALNDSVTSISDTLLADLRAINRQFNVLMNLVIGALIDLQDGVEEGSSQWVQDTSEENTVAQTQGKVDQCTNSGLVEGDCNVGGVLGSMAIEYALNPEDDGALNLTFGATYETNSVVLSCVNQGGVTGKKDCVGGVDGVSYTGHAQSAELSFLQTLEGVPAEFTSFRLILRADGRVIQTIPFTFGQRLSRIELPAPPEKEGCFGIWPAPEDDTPCSE